MKQNVKSVIIPLDDTCSRYNKLKIFIILVTLGKWGKIGKIFDLKLKCTSLVWMHNN